MAVRKSIPVGTTFGRLTVICQASDYISPDGRKHAARLLCKCSCGNERIVHAGNLTTGKSQSCGCLTTERSRARSVTHGASGTREHSIWKGIRKRCLNVNSPHYKDYGGRGIQLCDRWRDFAGFIADMGPCPPGFSIERVDVNGHYEPSNCIWMERRKQGQNTRRVRLTPEARALALSMRAEGATQLQIATVIGMDRSAVGKFLRGKAFR